MVLEVVSKSSVEKDMVTLPEAYYRTGIREFWRADAREELTFEIFRWTPTGYELTRLPDGWHRSDVFDRAFLLPQRADPLGQPRYTLQMRS